MADKTTGLGAELQLGDGNPSLEKFTAIPSIPELKFPFAAKGKTIDTTCLDSTGPESIPGMGEAEAFEIGLLFDPSDEVHQDLRDLAISKAERNWRIVFPDSEDGYEFAGYIDAGDHEFAVDKPMSMGLTLQITGAVTPIAE